MFFLFLEFVFSCSCVMINTDMWYASRLDIGFGFNIITKSDSAVTFNGEDCYEYSGHQVFWLPC